MKKREQVLLAPYSSFFVGGPADFFFTIETKEDLLAAIDYGEKQKIPFFPLGGATNVLFSDAGFRGMILLFRNKRIIEESSLIVAEAGATPGEIFSFAREQGRDFSPFVTLPGTIGGGVFGNAGIPEAEIGDSVVAVELFDTPTKKFFRAERDFFSFGYRKSILSQRPTLLVWRVFLDIPLAKQEEINSRARHFALQRKIKQPWGKTAGSFFRNPEKASAGWYLEQSGFLGKKRGPAFFSEKHANFLMNSGDASQKELRELAKEAQETVYKKFDVLLQPEVRLLDEWGKIQNL